MMLIVLLLSVLFVLGLVGVSSKPSPIFGGVSLIASGGLGCGLIVSSGGSFLGLMVFLVYLGGMMVVFGYTTAMATEEYPEAWVSSKVVLCSVMMGVVVEVMMMVWMLIGGSFGLYDLDFGGYGGSVLEVGFSSGLIRGDYVGSSFMYGLGSWLLLISAWVLFISILIIIEIVRGVK
uniref:NADH dehydrogenase subunit 6 n=1 Tax=Macroscelides micus TaxID=1460501 RepID=UPI0024357066|nr:NADH dehydrogenase subunit 6 [Macroscelides micus]WEW63457.1 NADH dehydrogenase subunit 6 [Macroscelides micus]